TWGWINFYQINLIGVAFAFFIAGHAAHKVWDRAVSAPRWCAGALIVTGLAVVATFNLNRGCRWDFVSTCGLPGLSGRFGVGMIYGEFGNLPLFLLTATAGAVFATTLSILLARFAGIAADRLARWGRASLDLLIVNGIFLDLLNPIVARYVAPEILANNVPF